MSINKIHNIKFHTCSGPSMYPTIKNGDVIEYTEFNNLNELQVGDIILFRQPIDKYFIIHRIVKIINNKLQTRGDNNNKPDPFAIAEKDIIGKVTSVERAGKIISISNGRKGYLIHKTMLLRKRIAFILIKPLRSISLIIDKIHIFSFLHKYINTTIIQMDTKHGLKKLLIYHGKVIGYKKGKNGIWKIKFPYKFFINKNKIESK